MEKEVHMSREDILEGAKKCVCGDRDRIYGDPAENFQTIAVFWGQYLWARHPEIRTVIAPNELVKAADVASMLSLQKISRIAGGKVHMDNWIDLAGYASCGGEIQSSTEAIVEGMF